MVFVHPEALWLILPLSALWLGVALFARARRRRAAAAFVAAAMWPHVLPPDSPERFWAKTGLWLAALVLGMVALAGPQFGEHFEQVQPRGSDMYVLIDVSKSMLADDVPPSRLGRAKSDVAELLQHLNGERIALIAFAGKAVVKCPLTTDYNYFRAALGELSPASAPRGGTAIGDAIRKALELLPREGDRDQTLLLITDGDDQQSYPLDAAAAAAEQRVAIFTIGLGDTEKGARIPTAKDGSTAFMEYNNEQVWSKLDSKLLGDIALKTNGVYVPAGTKAYDLGQLYEDHLKGRRASNAKEQRRMHLSQQYQMFLAFALLCLLIELLIRPYPPPELSSGASVPARAAGKPLSAGAVAVLLLILFSSGNAGAAEPPAAGGTAVPAVKDHGQDAGATLSPRAAVSEGLALYGKDDFTTAHDKFAQAADEFRKSQETLNAAIAAFDAACAAHRKGETEKARESYLEAGLARDAWLASEAHFNLGCLAAETARTLAGEKPEELAADKRKEVTEKLVDAAIRFRHCLSIKPDHAGARKNLELVREWVKYYADKWRAMDRERMRRDSNLVQFLDFLIKTQQALREDVKELKPTSSLDAFAERKRMQDELREEIEPLKEKIKNDLTPPPQQAAQPGAPPAPKPPQPAMDPKQLEEGIRTLQSWADLADGKMKVATDRLTARQPAPAADEQKGAAGELTKIWEAVVPFAQLLDRDLQDQTHIAEALKPETDKPGEDVGITKADGTKKEQQTAGKADGGTGRQNAAPALETAGEKNTELAEDQEQKARWTGLLKLKAESELKQAEQMPKPQQAPTPPPPQPNAPQPGDKKQPAPPDPEKIKEGLRKAVELAPKAFDRMSAAAMSLRSMKPDAAYPDAEEARKILEEIKNAQPKQEKQDQKDQDKKDQDKQKQDEQKKDEQKQDEKKDQKQEEQKQMSQDQIEAALRKVREREKQKHERDEEMKARILRANPGVEKDW